MELKLKLNCDDFLIYQLYTASKKKSIRNKRNTEWILSSVFFGILGFLFYLSDNIVLFYYFIFVGLASFILLPFYIRWKYKKHYLKHVQDVYKNNFGKEAIINFSEEYIESSDAESEGKIKYTQIKEINETGTHFFIKFSSGHALILPKSMCEKIDDVTTFFKNLTEKYDIKYNHHLDWKWR